MHFQVPTDYWAYNHTSFDNKLQLISVRLGLNECPYQLTLYNSAILGWYMDSFSLILAGDSHLHPELSLLEPGVCLD